MSRFAKFAAMLGALFGASGWMIIAILLYWQIRQPDPVVLEGCREVVRPAGAATAPARP